MIHTSRQLKALVRNRSNGDNVKAAILIRNYVVVLISRRIPPGEGCMSHLCEITKLKMRIIHQILGEINGMFPK